MYTRTEYASSILCFVTIYIVIIFLLHIFVVILIICVDAKN